MTEVSTWVDARSTETFSVQDAWRVSSDLPEIMDSIDRRSGLKVIEAEPAGMTFDSRLGRTMQRHAFRRAHLHRLPLPWPIGRVTSGAPIPLFEFYGGEQSVGLTDIFYRKRSASNVWQPGFSLIAFRDDSSVSQWLETFVLAADSAATGMPITPFRQEPTNVGPLSGFDVYMNRNWDGLDADPITQGTIDAARELIGALPTDVAPPDVAPGADGTIGLEWISDSGPLRKLYLDVGPGKVWRAYWRRTSGETGRVSHQAIDEEISGQIAAFFKELKS